MISTALLLIVSKRNRKLLRDSHSTLIGMASRAGATGGFVGRNHQATRAKAT
jgi:hypothetical protein